MTLAYRALVPVELASPLHLGSIDAVPDTEVPGAGMRRAFARNANGALVLRGSSVAGAMRACLRSFGRGGDEAWGKSGRASLISIPDVNLAEELEATSASHRDGVGINRVTGAAAHGFIHQVEVLRPGTSLTLVIEAQCDRAQQACIEEELAYLLAIFKDGLLRLGGSTSSGMGRIKLGGAASVRRYELDELDGMLGWITDPDGTDPGAKAHDWTPRGIGLGSHPGTITITITWRPTTGILVGWQSAETDPGEPRNLTRTVRDRADGTPVLPGSSIKGALRNRATRIARTVQGDERTDWSEAGLKDQLATDPALVRRMFGSVDRRAAIDVADVRASHPTLGSQAEMTTRWHNALDRWTGAVVDGRLFGQEAATSDSWEPISLVVDSSRLGTPDQTRAAMCLLGLTVAELATGTVSLGRGGTRGLGTVLVSGISIKANGPDPLCGEWHFPREATGDLVADLLCWLRTDVSGPDFHWDSHIEDPGQDEADDGTS